MENTKWGVFETQCRLLWGQSHGHSKVTARSTIRGQRAQRRVGVCTRVAWNST